MQTHENKWTQTSITGKKKTEQRKKQDHGQLLCKNISYVTIQF